MTVSDSAIEGISGALGGIIALTATYPLMTIATLQAVRQKKRTGGGSPAANVSGDATLSTKSQSKLQDFVQARVTTRALLYNTHAPQRSCAKSLGGGASTPASSPPSSARPSARAFTFTCTQAFDKLP